MIEIFIPGTIISQKNMLRPVRRGSKMFIMKDPKVAEWREQKKASISGLAGVLGPVAMEVRIVRENKRVGDLDNMLATINDFLKEYKIIEDDNCKILQDVHIYFDGVDKEKAGAYIRIEELEDTPLEGTPHKRTRKE